MKACGLSTSEMLSAPLALSGALVSARTTVALESTATSFVPLIVTCTVPVLPSAAETVNVSETDCPNARLSKALVAVYDQAPFAASENVPYVPATLLCGTKLAALSTSVMVNVPAAVTAASGPGTPTRRRVEHGRIVGPLDRHLHRTRRTVDRRDGEGVREALPDVQAVERRVGTVGPGAIRGDRESAIETGDVALRDEGAGVVDVADGQSTARRNRRIGLAQDRVRRRQHRRVVRARNGHLHRAGRPIGRRHGKRVGYGL